MSSDDLQQLKSALNVTQSRLLAANDRIASLEKSEAIAIYNMQEAQIRVLELEKQVSDLQQQR